MTLHLTLPRGRPVSSYVQGSGDGRTAGHRATPGQSATRLGDDGRTPQFVGSLRLYPAASLNVPTLMCGQRTPLKIRIDSWEYWSWRNVGWPGKG
jgi:hypothetical protein